MRQERQAQNKANSAISYYQAFQNNASLDSIDGSLFSNYDIDVDAPMPVRAMYMTDQYGNESIVPQEPQGGNQAYRLYKS